MVEERLIFIISQPRAGSTLTQKLLSNNGMVDTVSEPWLLLPLLSIYRPDLIEAKYNYPVALNGFKDYLRKKNAWVEFRHGLKMNILSLYKVEHPNQFFIDKTPRYYEILPEMIEFFPNAKFLVLKRNPFASLYSMLTTWSSGKLDYRILKSFYRDFLVAPFLIEEFCSGSIKGKNFQVMKYEDLVASPYEEVGRLYDWLQIPFDSSVLRIAENEKIRGMYGDDVYKKKILANVSSDNLESWKDQAGRNKELSIFFGDYQEYLGHRFLKRYGYEPYAFDTSRWRIGKTSFQTLLAKVSASDNSIKKG